MMADFSSVPVIDVHTGNLEKVWPMLMSAVRSATFVAIDTELSGLGNRRKLFAKDMDERYKNMCDVAKTRSIIALGLSCFQHAPLRAEEKMCSNNFLSQTFNILILCNEEYIVDPASLRFLVEHGFDFNTQYSLGIPYDPASTKPEDCPSIQRLFAEVMLREVPVVLHNGIVDLVFMYQAFHCALPGSLSTFLADVSLMFAGGLYDTKLIAEFQARESASYLEYVFRKCQRTNVDNSLKGENHVTMSFLSYSTTFPNLKYLPCGLQLTSNPSIVACENYASHGWCTEGSKCPLSHDIDVIIDKEDDVQIKKRKKKRKRRKNKEVNGDDLERVHDGDDAVSVADDNMEVSIDTLPNTMEISNEPNLSTYPIVQTAADSDKDNKEDIKHPHVVKEGRTEGHRAGFDAYMTAFAFACYVTSFAQNKTFPHTAKLTDFDMHKFVNKLSLSGKDIPLQIVKSSFTKPSKKHRERMDQLKKTLTLQ